MVSAMFDLLLYIREIYRDLWWKFMPGTVISIPWPTDIEDPNELHRLWLEKHVGIQAWDWDWKVSYGQSDRWPTSIIIKFIFNQSKHATQASLMWG